MTNNQTIDGVSRELIARAVTAAHIADCPSLRNELRALLDAPAVERQEPACKRCGDKGTITSFMHCSEGGIPYENSPIECIEECTCVGQQSTIAQLQARVQELESGRGEPVAWANGEHLKLCAASRRLPQHAENGCWKTPLKSKHPAVRFGAGCAKQCNLRGISHESDQVTHQTTLRPAQTLRNY